ncbi:DUF4397 domain-containing protein [uncultured Microbacterium sp.]|uniref:DUF4397 domain-containing protein n=1 Tax=uncultured Microbacterium sp. TaxID=191216 RepID=UPI0035CB26D7
MNLHVSRRARVLAAAGALVLGAALAVPAAASAAPIDAARTAPAAAGDTGWLRLGHFSPDTKDVDIRVSALRGGSVVFELDGVGYGDVSPYKALQPGDYTVSMIASGTGDWSKLAISGTVTVGASTATTMAAYGPSKRLQIKPFTDDLTSPASGNARIRVIQASTITPTVDVRTSTGTSIARAARAGSASSYAEVPAGNWTLQLTGTGVSDTADVAVAAGSVTSLFVLDNAKGGLTILPILDSAAAPVVPIGGVQTGGGWLAGHPLSGHLARLGASAVVAGSAVAG